MPMTLIPERHVLFFWAGESGAPVHLHAAVRRATVGSAKFWPLSDDGYLMAATATPPMATLGRCSASPPSAMTLSADCWVGH